MNKDKLPCHRVNFVVATYNWINYYKAILRYSVQDFLINFGIRVSNGRAICNTILNYFHDTRHAAENKSTGAPLPLRLLWALRAQELQTKKVNFFSDYSAGRMNLDSA